MTLFILFIPPLVGVIFYLNFPSLFLKSKGTHTEEPKKGVRAIGFTVFRF
jgi:hypothetical protein